MAEDGSKKEKATAPLIGILAVKKEFISDEQLQTALAQCSDAGNLDEQLKEYFLAQNLISAQNVHRLSMAVKAVAIQQQEYRFGAIALARGFVNKSVMELALEEQKEQFKKGKKPRRIGDVMVEAGLLTIKQRDEVLTLQKRSCNLPEPVGKPPLKTKATENKPSAGQKAQNILENGRVSNDETSLEPLAQGVEISGGLLLQVSCDSQSVFLSKMCDMEPDIPAVVIRTALAEKGIVFGLLPDERIEEFIKAPIADSILFRVAHSGETFPGQANNIEFFFNTDYLKTGGIDDFGNIDFKNWGPRPVVKKGTVLASKIADGTPRPFKDVFGNDVLDSNNADDSFALGIGTELSQDGQKVLAAVQGAPRISLSGLICVHEEYDIDGDIDLNTSLVISDRHGNIRVTGSIKSGAGICGVDVSAQQVNNGIIEANGDVTIARGINDARVYARGNVYAQSIINSEIVCMGDVFVKEEIVDSKIECAGACSIISGALISSRVSAKMGLMAKSIRAGKAGPVRIEVGHDAFAARELEKNEAEEKRVAGVILNLDEKKGVLFRQIEDLKKHITELDRAKAQTLSKYRELESRSEISLDDHVSLESRLTELRKQLKAAEANMQTYALNLKGIAKKAAKIDREIAEPTALKKALADEKRNLIRWSRHTPGKPRVIVDEQIVCGTEIQGLYNTFVAEADHRHVRIIERPFKSDGPESPRIIYQMHLDEF